jgi:hypothetical protein
VWLVLTYGASTVCMLFSGIPGFFQFVLRWVAKICGSKPVLGLAGQVTKFTTLTTDTFLFRLTVLAWPLWLFAGRSSWSEAASKMCVRGRPLPIPRGFRRSGYESRVTSSRTHFATGTREAPQSALVCIIPGYLLASFVMDIDWSWLLHGCGSQAWSSVLSAKTKLVNGKFSDMAFASADVLLPILFVLMEQPLMSLTADNGRLSGYAFWVAFAAFRLARLGYGCSAKTFAIRNAEWPALCNSCDYSTYTRGVRQGTFSKGGARIAREPIVGYVGTQKEEVRATITDCGLWLAIQPSEKDALGERKMFRCVEGGAGVAYRLSTSFADRDRRHGGASDNEIVTARELPNGWLQVNTGFGERYFPMRSERGGDVFFVEIRAETGQFLPLFDKYVAINLDKYVGGRFSYDMGVRRNLFFTLRESSEFPNNATDSCIWAADRFMTCVIVTRVFQLLSTVTMGGDAWPRASFTIFPNDGGERVAGAMKGTYDLDTFAMIATFCFAVLLVLKVVKPITDIVVSSTYLHLQATAKQHLKIGMAAGLESDSESGETGRASKWAGYSLLFIGVFCKALYHGTDWTDLIVTALIAGGVFNVPGFMCSLHDRMYESDESRQSRRGSRGRRGRRRFLDPATCYLLAGVMRFGQLFWRYGFCLRKFTPSLSGFVQWTDVLICGILYLTSG